MPLATDRQSFQALLSTSTNLALLASLQGALNLSAGVKDVKPATKGVFRSKKETKKTGERIAINQHPYTLSYPEEVKAVFQDRVPNY